MSLRAACEEEFDSGNLVHMFGEHKQDSRLWVFILAFVQGINDDKGLDLCCLEWTNNEFLHLQMEGLPSNTRLCSQEFQQLLAELRISIGELESKGGEDCMKITPAIGISGAKETRSEISVCKSDFGNCLSDGRLPCPSKAIQPEHVLVFLVLQPSINL